MMRDFGTDLTITPPGGGAPIQVDDGQGGLRLPRGIFEDAFEGVDVDDETEVGSTNPQLIVPSHEIGASEPGWSLAVNGITYTIEVLKSDGTGFHVFVLSYAAG